MQVLYFMRDSTQLFEYWFWFRRDQCNTLEHGGPSLGGGWGCVIMDNGRVWVGGGWGFLLFLVPYGQQGRNVEAKMWILSNPLVQFGIHTMRPLKYLKPDLPGEQYVRNLWWRKFWDLLGPDWTFGLLISRINNEGSRGPPMAWPNQAIVAFDRPYHRGTIYPKTAMTHVLHFLWGSIQYQDFAIWGLIQRDLWGPLRPGKLAATACRSTHSRV